MQSINIQTEKPYQVLVGNDLLNQTATLLSSIGSYQKVVIVTDDHVAPLYLNAVKNSFPSHVIVFSYIIPNGEKSKNLVQLAALWDFYAEQKITRSDLIIALGGGVVGDLTGFSASSYLRGVPYVQIPTTLLAQVDSSVGGKTAINIPQGKNLVGSFYQPAMVLCDIDTLSTLSADIFSDGLGEIIKYACIYDKKLFEQIRKIKDPSVLTSVIIRCIGIKSEIVAGDEFDTGKRMTLNFGHTIGHAIEKYHHFTDYSHGRAVAIGMIHLTRLAEKSGLTTAGCAEQIEALCKQVGLPTICDVPEDQLFEICCLDKKNINQHLNIILLHDIGSCYIHQKTPEDFQKFLEAE